MARRLISAVLIVVGALLLAAPLVGLLRPADLRPRFAEETLPYGSALALLDAAYAQDGATRQFLEGAVAIYDAATVYEWPREIARVPVTDNWILWAAAWADPVVKDAGLTDLDDLFTVYESVSYERALGRGFGSAAQNALGLIDLLGRRYAIPAYLVELDGHAVAEAMLPTGERSLLDPSLGVFLPFGLGQAGEQAEALQASYAATGHPGVAAKYAAAGNLRLEQPGTRPFRPKLYLVERATDVLKWVIPVVMIGIGLLLWPRRSRRPAYRPGTTRR